MLCRKQYIVMQYFIFIVPLSKGTNSRGGGGGSSIV